MMDSHDTNQPLKQGELEEEKKAVEVSEEITETPAEETIVEKPTENASKLSTKEEVLLRLKEVAQDAENANKQELDGLKQTFEFFFHATGLSNKFFFGTTILYERFFRSLDFGIMNFIESLL